MSKLDERFRLGLDGRCNPDCVVQGPDYRFTVLTPQMLRMEYSRDGAFEDRPTQTVWNRNFDRPVFRVQDSADCVEIDTEYFHLFYDKKGFSQNHLYIDVKYAFTNYGGRWYYGRTDYGNPPREHNLKGTARTLDRCNGQWYEGSNLLERVRAEGGKINRCDGDVDLGRGLCDTSGRTFFDDSKSLVIDEDGWVHPRSGDCTDIYFFGYGRDYFRAIHDFYQLSGPVPMLPKYALGNWWSRYWKYTEKSYMELLTRFQQEDIPFTVAVIDMDWHLVDIPEKFGKGWTGYTWNRELFPDPKRFLDWLHEHGYRITLNLHPADGVRAFEEQYLEMAKALGVDPASEDPVRFDFTNIEFIEAYFKYLHHPNEEAGVDFWWMDWQQGNVSAVEGLDPMWMLNHYHHYDRKRDGKRAIMLSRYSGLGSQRYPIGFSGDVHMTWDSLEFQPYFTATAANVGYTWWSHDVGGHLNGVRDNELYIRWLELGVFSPVNRLHSNSNPFCAKEPWRYPKPYDDIAAGILRLRHRLIPYLYTMNYQCHQELKPVVVPAYYYYPMEPGSYQYRNEYFFGSELLVQPMVHPTDPQTGYTFEETWLPAGLWTDIYTGRLYDGGIRGRNMTIGRPIEQQGVLAKPGAIIPMSAYQAGENGIENPQTLEIYVFPGGNNQFCLFEDTGDGFEYEQGVCLKTEMTLKWEDNHAVFQMAAEGDYSVIPEKRHYQLHFRGFADVENIVANGCFERSYDGKTHTLTLFFRDRDPACPLTVTLRGALKQDNRDLKERVFAFLDGVQGSTVMKNAIYQCFESELSPERLVSAVMALNPPDGWKKALLEMVAC
ncbi:MAG: glycoside hydrolase family 31 protein [Clostridiales bacterium]|nr:glycoside hydrolase family 31 protein [Clostridiales bacterium]